MTIHLDFETRSKADIKKVGAYEYAADPSTDVLCLAYTFDNEEAVPLWRPGAVRPDYLHNRMAEGELLEAWNVGFERLIWHFVMVKRYGWPEVPDAQWRCAMAKARTYALPGDLDGAAMALGTMEKKDRAGKALMLKLSRPRKPSKHDPSIWHTKEEELERLFLYCKQDVRAERAVSNELRDMSPYELRVWQLDQKINMRGMPVDLDLCRAAIELDKEAKADLCRQLFEVTGCAVSKPSERKAMIAWLKENGVEPPSKVNPKGEVIETAETKGFQKLLKETDLSQTVRRAVELFMAANKTSVTKYAAMIKRAGISGLLREMFGYHVASTGRWAGRGVQLHNLPRPPEDLSNMEELALDILAGDYERLRLLYGNDRVLTVLSSALRGALTASPKHELKAADFSAVEARGLAWIAGDEELLEVFRKLDADPKADWDVYTWQASQILGERVTKKDKEKRQNFGKVPTLGCGYAMSARKLVLYAEGMGIVLSYKDAKRIVKAWRTARKAIVAFWPATENAALEAVRRAHLKERAITQYGSTWSPDFDPTVRDAVEAFSRVPVKQGKLVWKVVGRFLHCRLPSGRMLSYLDPKIELRTISIDVEDEEGNVIGVNKFQKETLTFMGSNTYTNQWERCSTYGGKLTENIVQAICRDLLADAMLRQDEAGYDLALHVHDESVSDDPIGFGSLKEFEQIMSTAPAWAEGFPLKAEGWRGRRFRK